MLCHTTCAQLGTRNVYAIMHLMVAGRRGSAGSLGGHLHAIVL